MKIKHPEQLTDEILKIFSNRGGFDFWWHEIGDENRKEILNSIDNLIEANTNED